MAAEPKKIKGDLRVEGEVSLPNESASRATEVDSNGKLKSSSVTSTELGRLTGVTSNVQTQINDAQADATQALSDAAAAQADATQALADAAAAQADIDNHLSDTVDAHDASAISSIPAGNLAATDVQGALDELQSDVDTRALDSAVIKKNGSVAFTADQSMGGFKLTNVATPTAASHAATKEYVDNAIEGAKPKEAVRVATTAAISLATDLEAGDSIDGVTLVAGDRVLVKNQASASENGIYIASASGAASRSSDFDSISPIDEVNKAYVAVQEGTANQGKIFIQYGSVATLGTDPVNFTFYNSVSGLTGDDGITVSGSSISVDHDGQGLAFSAGQLIVELDGATLSKSASGVRVAASVITSISDAQTDATQALADAAAAQADATQALADAAAAQADIDNHLSDTTDAHDASAISVVPTGNLAASDVQSALNELQGDIDALAPASAGDIEETVFALANNQASPASVTGFAFANGVVRSFKAHVSVAIDATTDKFESFELLGIQKGADWSMAVEAVGDDSGVAFTITSAGQIQYTSTSNAGFVSGDIKFRAITTSI